MRRHKAALIGTIAALLGGFAWGWLRGGGLAGAIDALWIVAVLTVLEVSLSVDNAVVNAAVLARMSALWQRRFLTWGMLIAVFGMRLVFPLAMVAIAAGIAPMAALRLALEEPARYEALVGAAHDALSGFGGAFLLLVALDWFGDAAPGSHWITPIERPLAAFARARTARLALVAVPLGAIALSLPAARAFHFAGAGLIGVAAHLALAALARRLGTGGGGGSGFGLFVYLNVLDAAFSLDGVIGAFALSNDLVVIALGLSAGALFVRSITVQLMASGTLQTWRYLEHGAFWAIAALGAIMLVSVRIAVPDVLTGLVGAVLIGAALWSSRATAK